MHQAGTDAAPKSPVDRPCRYSSGNILLLDGERLVTSVICGDLRAHAGKIAEENRCRWPVSASHGGRLPAAPPRAQHRPR
jgi:hypothetical protein